jgi:hypothetical protein
MLMLMLTAIGAYGNPLRLAVNPTEGSMDMYVYTSKRSISGKSGAEGGFHNVIAE